MVRNLACVFPSWCWTRSAGVSCMLRTSVAAPAMPATGTMISKTIRSERPLCLLMSLRAIRSATRKLCRRPPGAGLTSIAMSEAGSCQQHRWIVHRRRLVHDPAVADEHHPVRPGRMPGLVGDEHDGSAGVGPFPKHLHHAVAGG